MIYWTISIVSWKKSRSSKMCGESGSRYDLFDVLARAERKGGRCEHIHHMVITGLDSPQVCGQEGSCA